MAQRRFFLPPLAVAAVFAFMFFWIVAALTDSNQTSELIRAILIPVSLAVVVSYSPDAFKALVAEKPSGVLQLCLGVVCSWIGFLGTSAWAMLFRLAGQPMWMLHADFPNLFAAMSCFGAVLHVSAPGTLYGTPKKAMVMVGAALGALVLILIGFIFAHPNIRGFTDAIRPYLEDKTAHERPFFEVDPTVFKRFNIWLRG